MVFWLENVQLFWTACLSLSHHGALCPWCLVDAVEDRKVYHPHSERLHSKARFLLVQFTLAGPLKTPQKGFPLIQSNCGARPWMVGLHKLQRGRGC